MSTPGFADAPPKPKPGPTATAAPAGFGDSPPGFGAKPPGQDFGDTPPSQAAPKLKGPPGLSSVNPGVNVIGDYLTEWTKYGAGGIRNAFRTVVDGLAKTFSLGIYDFDKGHHQAPNDPHLDGRAMDVDTINGEMVGTKLTPTIRSYITTALATPNVRVGVPKEIYAALPSSMKSRAFVDAPAHIHTELSQVMPGQTVAPAGFAPSPPKGFVKDPQAKPAFGSNPPQLPASTFATQPAAIDPDTGHPYPPSIGETVQMVHSAVNEIGGHQDLPFILYNAMLRDNAGLASPGKIAQQLRDPNSEVSKAWALYKHDPAQAMDEYGLGSPIQEKYLAQRYPGTGIAAVSTMMLKAPLLNFLTTFYGEQFNPMSWAEGAGAGKALGVAGDLMHGSRIAEMGDNLADTLRVGSPLRVLKAHDMPHDPVASQWGAGTIASLNAPWETPKIKMPSDAEVTKEIFDNFDQATKDEIVRLKQGSKPNLAFAEQHADLAQRAKTLKGVMGQVQGHMERTKLLTPDNTFDWANRGEKFFPMKGTYQFNELEEDLGGGKGSPGGVTSAHKTVADLDHAVETGKIDPQHDMAVNFGTWYRQSLQKVAFEDAIDRAPESLRRDAVVADFKNELGVPPTQAQQQHFPGVGIEALGKGFEQPDAWQEMQNSFNDFNSRLVGDEHNIKTQKLADEIGWKPKFGDERKITLESNPRWVAAKNLMPDPKRSPALAKSMVAPELWEFLRGETVEQPGRPSRATTSTLRRFIESSGSQLPGQEQSFVGRYVAMMRNMIMTNLVVHPAKNVAGNDALARGIYNLGGPAWQRGGYPYQAAMALAVEAGLKKPESFVGGAQQYSEWAGRALVQGGLAEFGTPRTAAFGGDYHAVMTSPSGAWQDRANRAFTKFWDINRERTFGNKGEKWMAVSFFKDAVTQGGMSDAEAARITRKFMGDYYNFDPKSPWSSFFYFLPFLKGNMSSWITALVRRPQYITGPQHALRNVNLHTDPQALQGAYPPPDWTVYTPGGTPYTVPFVGHNISNIAQAVANIPKGPEAVWQPLQDMLTARGTPLTTGAIDVLATGFSAFHSDLHGPETDWNVIVNTKAPPDVQYRQLGAYAATHFLPIPLVAYAAQDAVRKGMSWGDLGRAFVSASGAGFIGQAKLDSFTKRQQGKAQEKYLKAYWRYKGHGEVPGDGDLDSLKSAWDTYTDRLKDLGVVQ